MMISSAAIMVADFSGEIKRRRGMEMNAANPEARPSEEKRRKEKKLRTIEENEGRGRGKEEGRGRRGGGF